MSQPTSQPQSSMSVAELDAWYCSLSVPQKNHIACKIAIKTGRDTKDATYPNCWDYWGGLPLDKKQSIHDHCTDSHGMWIQEEGDGPIYSY